jgi:hypothetical protein
MGSGMRDKPAVVVADLEKTIKPYAEAMVIPARPGVK